MAPREWSAAMQEWMSEYQAKMAGAFPPAPPGMKWEFRVELGDEDPASNSRKAITEGRLVPIMDFGDG